MGNESVGVGGGGVVGGWGVTAGKMERIKEGKESCLAPFPNLWRLKLTAEGREIQFRVI